MASQEVVSTLCQIMLRSLTIVIPRMPQRLYEGTRAAAAVCSEVTQSFSVTLLSSHNGCHRHDVRQPGIRMHHGPRNLLIRQHLHAHAPVNRGDATMSQNSGCHCHAMQLQGPQCAIFCIRCNGITCVQVG